MKHFRKVCIAALGLALAACTLAAPRSTPPSAPTITAPPAAIRTVPATVDPTATPEPSATAEPSPTPLAGGWLVPAQELRDWPKDAHGTIEWVDEHTLAYRNEQYDLIHIDINSPEHLALSPAEPPFHNLNKREYLYSPKKTYAVVCTGKTGDHYTGLQLYRVADHQLIGEVKNIQVGKLDEGGPQFCTWSIAWAPDESALSYAVTTPYFGGFPDPAHPLPVDIYVWRTNGTQSSVIGHGSFADSAGTWSPDSKRIALPVYQPSAYPDEEYVYHLLYLDGRPQKSTKGVVSVRKYPMNVHWYNNDIIEDFGTCCGGCGFYNYFQAESGEPIDALSWGTCFPLTLPVQRGRSSPDEHWVVADQTDPNYLDTTKPVVFTYALYDTKTRQSYPLSASTEVVLDFLGWTADSSTFYLIRRPVNDTILPQYGAPFGLLALDAQTHQLRPVQPDLSFGWLSPDGQHLFGLTRSGENWSGAVYSLDGHVLTQQTPIRMPDDIAWPDMPSLKTLWYIPGGADSVDVVWSHDGARVVFGDHRAGLWLATTGGEVQKLVEGLRLSGSDVSGPYFSWSPGDQSLLVRPGASAWLVRP